MRELTACRSCSRYIAPDFRYCPYCGTERVRDYHFRHLLDQPFDRMERAVQEFSFRRLESIEEQLIGLEDELEHMIESRPADGRDLTRST
ncbi:MAG: hypothetical protein EA382_12380 [Spirochaetaceae bacterium]|nr:MAG: hypothetical protein EA382_12380 [Spirochaetaceae bacterium]